METDNRPPPASCRTTLADADLKRIRRLADSLTPEGRRRVRDHADATAQTPRSSLKDKDAQPRPEQPPATPMAVKH